ncbi:MAG: Organic hydroperoxide resistance transcriptional regulator [Bacteroidetes bacterium ADurb.Bin145]|jgi:DNA-binding MarR family transcriptional regulator|uniref:MarR family winged helix-turn-helix transcriptional regulator n=1 Tax=Methanospirillum sp. TaxID=45200 RepID=UPI0009C42579|nr:MarR family transcriptional regulator [Methanospirillum sp.]OQB56445.1 MAG: Organic hydroperoxide resistance transcriptional regulator [Bacteroidetes bacterium ADurb.Bin145]
MEERVHLMDELNETLVEFFDRFTSWESSVVESENMKISDAHAIEILGHYGRMNMKELAGRLGITTGTTTVAVDRLERKGFARRVRAEHDRRSYIIELTEEGTLAYEEHHRHHLNLASEIASILGEEDTQAFISILQKINEHI